MDSGLRRNDGGLRPGFSFGGPLVHSVVWALIIGRSGRPGRDVVVSHGLSPLQAQVVLIAAK